MRWWRGLAVALLAAAPAATEEDAQAEAQRRQRLAAFAEQHQLAQSSLYGTLSQRGYLRWAEPRDGNPASVSFWARVDGQPAHLVFVPAQAGTPPIEEGMYLIPSEPQGAAPRRLEPDARDGGFDHALGASVTRARRAPPRGEDPTALEQAARDARTDPALRDAVASSFDGALRRADLEARIARTQADIARKTAVADAQWSRTPAVASRVAGHLSGVVPPAISAGEISRAAGLNAPVALPAAPRSGRPGLVLMIGGEEEGRRAQEALRAHEAAVKKALKDELLSGGGLDGLWRAGSGLLAARQRAPERAVAVVDASGGLAQGARQATDGLSRMPYVGAGLGLAENGSQAARGERVWGTPLRGRIARRRVDQQTDVGRAAGEFARERDNLVRHAGDVAALQVFDARRRLESSFAAAGLADRSVLATGDSQRASELSRTLGGRGAFLQYRTSDGGNYFLPLTPDAALLRGRTGYADVAARADAAVSALARSGRLTPAAALDAWTGELQRAWGLPRAEAARLAASLHGR